LALRFNCSPAELARVNGLSSAGNDLWSGKLIKVPKEFKTSTVNEASNNNLVLEEKVEESEETSNDDRNTSSNSFFSAFDAELSRNTEKTRRTLRRLRQQY